MAIEKDNDIVYHYCSVEAFLNIIGKAGVGIGVDCDGVK